MHQFPTTIQELNESLRLKITEKLLGKKVLLVGGAGFLGGYLTQVLKSFGAMPIICDISTNSPNFIDILKPESINHLVKKFLPSCVVNLTADIYGSSERQKAINVDGFNHLVESCLRYVPETRFVGIGTCAEYGITPEIPISEDFDCAPISPYGETKLEACNLLLDRVETCGLWGNWIRPANIIGVGMDQRLILSQILSAMRTNKTTLEVNDPHAIRDYVSAMDIAILICQVLVSNKVGQIYNGSTGSGFSLLQVTEIASQHSGNKLHLIPKPKEGHSSAVRTFLASANKAKSDLQWQPISNVSETIGQCWIAIK